MKPSFWTTAVPQKIGVGSDERLGWAFLICQKAEDEKNKNEIPTEPAAPYGAAPDRRTHSGPLGVQTRA